MEAARTPEPSPQPELAEPRLHDPGPEDLSKRDWLAILQRAAKSSVEDQITDAAAALAYYVFLALPALLLLAYGLFSLLAGPGAITTILDKLGEVAPQETITLVEDSLRRAVANRGSGFVFLAIGSVLAVWTATSAMEALMRALNRAYGQPEARGFVRRRLLAVAMLVFLFIAMALVFALLVLGPQLSGWVGSAIGWEDGTKAVWWAAQWPILLVALLTAFAIVYYLGPNADHPRWQWVTPGAVIAVLVWLAASGGFAVYVSMFGSYNKAWGTLAAVVIMLTWLWLSALALLFGAEVNAEAERSRELRQGQTAEQTPQAPAKV
jgi:membrane protein